MIPLPPDALSENATSESERHEREFRFSGVGAEAASRCLVMVVDDDEAICEAVASVLEDRGYDVVARHDGKEALSFLKETTQRPCMILLDVMMPSMDGVTFRREQLNDPALAVIPVVMVTAGSPTVHQLADTEVLRKPIELSRLLSAVAERCAAASPT